MALQGDLDSFALPDVLRLLAGTGKTGRLAIDATDTSGELWVLDGDLVGGEVTKAPHASRPADVVFELIRLEGGSFVFEDGERLVDGTERTGVADAIEEAQSLLAEWADVEAVVPSVHASVRLVDEIVGDEIIVAAHQWRLLAAIGHDSTVRRLGDHFELTDLTVSRQVKDLAENGLVELGEATAEETDATAMAADADHHPETTADRDDDHVSDDSAEADDDLGLLRSEGGAVVMEESEDALLPEPLPGAGIEFDGDVEHLGHVDGREPSGSEFVAQEFVPEEFAAEEPVAGEPVGTELTEDAVAEPAEHSWSPFAMQGAAAEAEPSSLDDEPRHEDHDDRDEDDRASLMRFLSTVDN